MLRAASRLVAPGRLAAAANAPPLLVGLSRTSGSGGSKRSDAELKQFFLGISSVQDGGIATQDLEERMRMSGSTSSRLAALRFDANKDGVVTWEEFHAAGRETEAALIDADFFSSEALAELGIESFDERALRNAFDAADTDGSGELDTAELRRLLVPAVDQVLVMTNPALAGSDAFEGMLARVMARLDTDNNRRVSFEEFKAAFALHQLEAGWYANSAFWRPAKQW